MSSPACNVDPKTAELWDKSHYQHDVISTRTFGYFMYLLSDGRNRCPERSSRLFVFNPSFNIIPRPLGFALSVCHTRHDHRVQV